MTKVTGVCHPPAYLQILKELVPKTETLLLEAQDHGQHHRGDTWTAVSLYSQTFLMFGQPSNSSSSTATGTFSSLARIQSGSKHCSLCVLTVMSLSPSVKELPVPGLLWPWHFWNTQNGLHLIWCFSTVRFKVFLSQKICSTLPIGESEKDFNLILLNTQVPLAVGILHGRGSYTHVLAKWTQPQVPALCFRF